MGKLMGTIVGAFALSIVAAFVGTYAGATWSTITFFLALFLVLLIRPQGLFGDPIESA
jgi:branched-chain amino acid transport system permease protein